MPVFVAMFAHYTLSWKKTTFFLQQANIILNIFENSAILYIFSWKMKNLRFNAYQYINNCVYYIFQSHIIK